jgi:hypothetical protein
MRTRAIINLPLFCAPAVGLGDRLHKDLTRKCLAEQINQSLLVVPTTQYRYGTTPLFLTE